MRYIRSSFPCELPSIAPMGAERRLAAVMFTDMEGFTALMQSDEQLALAKRDQCSEAGDGGFHLDDFLLPGVDRLIDRSGLTPLVHTGKCECSV